MDNNDQILQAEKTVNHYYILQAAQRLDGFLDTVRHNGYRYSRRAYIENAGSDLTNLVENMLNVMRANCTQSIFDIDAFHDIEGLVKETVTAINNGTPIDAQLACSHLDEMLDYLHRRL